ncbi:pyruvate ferredoxin oxidoreductase [Candidatus Woesearchaeota archaeon]|nr:pyruvate ferredoxin oxidoreductase [Candidatus Woesearchaeota archaeon]
MNLKEMSTGEDRIASGHRLCPGCGLPIITRIVTRATDHPIVVGTATGCLEVSTTIYPYTSWKVPWIHNAFENVAATMSGVEAAYKALKRKGRLPGGDKEVKFLAMGGDGGTYDIGLQSLSGMLERGHDIVYVCLDNEGYMHTGIQRSSSTPYGAWTNTSQVGKVHKGKEQFKKDLTAVVAGHHIPYVAQGSPHNWNDLFMKAKKAFEKKGPAFINVLSPCVPGWKYNSDQTIAVAKMATDTCFWPLFEIEDDVWKLNYDPKDNKKPVVEWLKMQRRFAHLMVPENRHIVDALQQKVDSQWAWIKRQCGAA